MKTPLFKLCTLLFVFALVCAMPLTILHAAPLGQAATPTPAPEAEAETEAAPAEDDTPAAPDSEEPGAEKSNA